ncbi:MAG: PAS domain-containing protein, partial [Cellulomonadaceae bacterium]|nr:PAS domain-containing protein [Cellulomonadaceae bacterium]
MDARREAWHRIGLAHLTADWMDTSADLVVCLDDDMRLQYVNRTFETATGLSFDACAGRRLGELRPFGAATARVLTQLSRARDGTAEVEDLVWSVDGDPGHERQLQVHVRVERAADGAVELLLLSAHDVTHVRAVERMLLDSRAELRTLADNSPDNIIRYGMDGRATYCNQEIERRLDTTASTIVGELPLGATPPGVGGAEEYERVVFEALRTGRPGRVEITGPDPDGGQVTHSVLVRAERDAAGQIVGALAIGRDVTDLVVARQEAAEREREFRSLAENAGDRIARWDPSARYVYANPRMLEVLGKPADQVLGRTSAEVGEGRFDDVEAAVTHVVAGGGAQLVEQRFVDPQDGLERIHEVLCVPEHTDEGRLVSVLGVGRDITEAVHAREELVRIASTDLLTGLPNSQALFDRAPAILDAAQRREQRTGVLLLDLDGFKAVNDTVGHAGGDLLLRAVAEQVRAQLHPSDLFVRLGGDEFVILIGGVSSTDDLAAVADKVLSSLNELSEAPASRGASIGGSIGVAVFPEDGVTVETLVAHADIAMYQAKRAGRGRVEYFRPALGAAVARRAAIERALAEPGLVDDLVMYVQPVFRIGTDVRLVGAEALLRWNHPRLGMVQPDEFIPIAEESGAIVALGRWVLQEAAATAARWNRGNPQGAPLTIAVNFSTRQFVLDDVAVAIDEALTRSGCLPEWIVAEITESLLL